MKVVLHNTSNRVERKRKRLGKEKTVIEKKINHNKQSQKNFNNQKREIQSTGVTLVS